MTVISFETVREIGAALPGVAEGTSYGSPALKLGGKVIACVPTNKTAEAGCVVVHVGFELRDRLLEQSPDIYTTTEHYLSHPCVLVRLGKIKRAELTRLLHDAHAFALSTVHSRPLPSTKRAKPATRKAVSTRKPSI
ncbi:MmcQ/YjbR family DNA-binding protein [Dyella mobilis]|uniref:MmcQ/YjbR family DNA-binding protein n=1 Tax=Dyella mobilis TaxID=1849582 RepID=A0ABS2KE54_9GAMM|nr:MmcQ/YjbR family DNA-binding protein [Dyella mobilis]MBM7129461.1 MmcQ/YjbR family DNA-binding protein [Dyella mobilis]GLQ98275.1 hypothetical protein GCM10007863_26950 [Dyella mobilis]